MSFQTFRSVHPNAPKPARRGHDHALEIKVVALTLRMIGGMTFEQIEYKLAEHGYEFSRRVAASTVAAARRRANSEEFLELLACLAPSRDRAGRPERKVADESELSKSTRYRRRMDARKAQRQLAVASGLSKAREKASEQASEQAGEKT